MKWIILVLLSYVMTIISYSKQLFKYLIRSIEITVNKTKLILQYSFKLFKILFKRYFLILLKSVSFVLLFCSAVSMTFDYLSYPYIYKLIVSDNNRGFDLPAISFCTERNVFFDKNKINEYFNSSEEYKRGEQEFQRVVEQNFIVINCEKNKGGGGIHDCDHFINDKYFNLSLILKESENKIFENFSFDEMKNLTISANELFNCSAKLHFRNESFVSNATIIENCFDRFEVLQSIYGNEFGICYTFFAKNYSIFLKDDDYIQFNISYETQQSFLMSWSQINFYTVSILYSDYFKLNMFIYENRRKFEANGQSKLNYGRTGLNADLNFRKTSVDLLSTPYMQKCLKYGMS